MMFQTKHKYFNNKIKMWLLILMWTLMWQHVYGKSSTYDDSDVAVYANDTVADTAATNDTDIDNEVYDDVDVDVAVDDDDDGPGQDVLHNMDTFNSTMISAAGKKSMTTTTITTATESYEDYNNNKNNNNNNNATIYGHINENDNNSYKLPTNVAGEGNQPTSEQLEVATSSTTSAPPVEQVLMAKDQLNETTNYELAPQDNGMLVFKEGNQQTEHNDQMTSESTDECNDQVNVNNNITEVTATKMHAINTSSISDYDTEPDYEPRDLRALLHVQLIRQFVRQYKQLSRVTLFTCKATCTAMACEDYANYKRPSLLGNKSVITLLQVGENPLASSGSSGSYNDLMLKVVTIDHLIAKRSADANTGRQRGVRGERNDFRNMGTSSGTRSSFTNPNWLDQVLRPEHFHQVVVVDLSCGLTSRRLLEMASNKALFNSMYHWLLMEDYVFNRQTEIDDADDMKNKMNSGCSPTTGCTRTSGSSESNSTTTTTYNTDKEVVNDSTKSAMLAKKTLFSSSTADVVGASASGSGRLNKRQLYSSTANSYTGYKPSTSARTSGAGAGKTEKSTSDRSGGTGGGAGGGNGAGGADEDDMEIIEKFLEKLNININTELILAKRRMRSIVATTSDFAHDARAANPAMAQSIMMPSVANSASSGSGDYNTLQKMDYYILYDVWNPGLQYGGHLNISEVGYFSLGQGLKFNEWYFGTSIIMRRLNMQLARVRCLVVVTHKNESESLHEYLITHNDTHLDSMNRFNFALLSHVRDLFNFSFILSKTSTWGYLKNGKFDGMIGALVRRQADIGGSPIFFRIERAKVIDYTTRTWVARPCFIFRHPRSTKKDRIVFLQPFSNDVWILLAACGVATILLLWCLTTLEPAATRPVTAAKTAKMLPGGGFKKRLVRWSGLLCGYDLREDDSTTQRVGLFLESILFYVGSICQQGLSFSTRSFSGRCIVITSLLFSFAIYQFYSASIVGTLLMEKPKTIRTLRDLIHSSLEIGIEDIVYNRDYFLRTKDPDAQELYAKKVTSMPTSDSSGFVDAPPDNFDLPNPPAVPMTEAQKAKAYRDILHSHETGAHAKTNEASNWYEPEFGVAKIKKGQFAFHVDVATAYKIMADTFTEKEICDLTEIQLFPPQKMVSIVQKGSPLRKPITYGLRRVTEVGLMDYERKIWHSPKPRCVKQLHTDDLQVDMQTFSSALLVLVFGFLVSGLILSLEMAHHRMWQRYTTTTATTMAN